MVYGSPLLVFFLPCTGSAWVAAGTGATHMARSQRRIRPTNVSLRVQRLQRSAMCPRQEEDLIAEVGAVESCDRLQVSGAPILGRKIGVCHLIFLAPILALLVFWLLPFSLALPIYLGVLGLTALFIWPMIGPFRRVPITGQEGMMGVWAEALTALNPRGLVRCQGEVWEAKAEEPIPSGEQVWVLGIHRLILSVGRHDPSVAGCCYQHGGYLKWFRMSPGNPTARR